MHFLVQRAAYGVRPVLGQGAHHAPVFHAVPHQGHGIPPDRFQLRRGHILAGPVGADTGAEQKLRPINVADAAHNGLVHQQHTYRRFSALHECESRARVRSFNQRVRADAGFKRPPFAIRKDAAVRRAAQLQPLGFGPHAPPQRAFRLGHGLRAFPKITVPAQVDMHRQVAPEPVPKVLADALDLQELAPVQQAGVREAAVRRIGPQLLPDERFRVQQGEAMDFVAFRHGSMRAS